MRLTRPKVTRWRFIPLQRPPRLARDWPTFGNECVCVRVGGSRAATSFPQGARRLDGPISATTGSELEESGGAAEVRDLGSDGVRRKNRPMGRRLRGGAETPRPPLAFSPTFALTHHQPSPLCSPADSVTYFPPLILKPLPFRRPSLFFPAALSRPLQATLSPSPTYNLVCLCRMIYFWSLCTLFFFFFSEGGTSADWKPLWQFSQCSAVEVDSFSSFYLCQSGMILHTYKSLAGF